MIPRIKRAELYDMIFKADNEFDDANFDMMLEGFYDSCENIREEYKIKREVKKALFDVLSILDLDRDYSDWYFECGEWKQ